MLRNDDTALISVFVRMLQTENYTIIKQLIITYISHTEYILFSQNSRKLMKIKYNFEYSNVSYFEGQNCIMKAVLVLFAEKEKKKLTP